MVFRTLFCVGVDSKMKIGLNEVPKLVFGTWAIGGPNRIAGRENGRGHVDFNDAVRGLQMAIERGYSFFDTADVYGDGVSEMLLRKASEGRSNRVMICTKFGNRDGQVGRKDFSENWCTQSVDASLRRLNREVIDVLLLHSPSDDFNWDQYDSNFLDVLVKKGKIRTYGVSSKSLTGAKRVMDSSFGSVIQLPFSVLDRGILALSDGAKKRGVTIMGRAPLSAGFLTEKIVSGYQFGRDDVRALIPEEELSFRIEAARRVHSITSRYSDLKLEEAALRFCLNENSIDQIVVGFRTSEQLLNLIEYYEKGPLPTSIKRLMIEACPRRAEGVSRAVCK
jgi:aryl-alcohol dehydrogenase-like predicted oxidoreductase